MLVPLSELILRVVGQVSFQPFLGLEGLGFPLVFLVFPLF